MPQGPALQERLRRGLSGGHRRLRAALDGEAVPEEAGGGEARPSAARHEGVRLLYGARAGAPHRHRAHRQRLFARL